MRYWLCMTEYEITCLWLLIWHIDCDYYKTSSFLIVLFRDDRENSMCVLQDRIEIHLIYMHCKNMNCLYFVERYTAFIGQRCDSWNYSWRYEMWLLYVSTGNCICLIRVFSMFICHWVAANDLIFTSLPFWHTFNVCLSLFCSFC